MPDVPRPVTYPEAGERLRALRRRRGLSHDRLRDQMAMSSRQHLINIEKGWHKPGPELMAALSEALGENVASFYEVEAQDEDDEEAAPLAGKSLDEILKMRIDTMVRESLQAHIPTTEVEAA